MIQSEALSDIAESIRRWRLWGREGVMEVRRRYRRTVLGPFWASLSMALLVGSMGVLFATLWKMDVSDYLPYLMTGFLAWLPTAAIIIESCSAFIEAQAILTQMRLPLTLFIFRVVWRNLIVFGHHLVVYLVIVLLFDVPVNWNTLLVLPGLLFFCVNGIWIGLLIGALATRYRDVKQLVSSLLQILLFITPIFWPADQLVGKRAFVFVDVNVFYHLVSVIRDPLLGKQPAALSWYVAAAVAVLGWTLMLILFGRIRRRLPYWL